jgi:hypothetical protein
MHAHTSIYCLLQIASTRSVLSIVCGYGMCVHTYIQMDYTRLSHVMHLHTYSTRVYVAFQRCSCCESIAHSRKYTRTCIAQANSKTKKQIDTSLYCHADANTQVGRGKLDHAWACMFIYLCMYKYNVHAYAHRHARMHTHTYTLHVHIHTLTLKMVLISSRFGSPPWSQPANTCTCTHQNTYICMYVYRNRTLYICTACTCICA